MPAMPPWFFIFLGALALLSLAGILTPQEALAGFSARCDAIEE
jgi:di/tricarboxylate transporter